MEVSDNLNVNCEIFGLPNNLDIEVLVQKYPPDFKFNIQHLRYIISLITSIPAHNKDILDSCDFVPLNAKTLQKSVREYRKYLDYLICCGVLEENRQYIAGIKSRGYKFTPLYQTRIIIDKTSVKTIKCLKMKNEEYNKAIQLKYSYLYKWLNPKLKIDFKKAVEYLNTELSENNDEPYSQLRKFNCGYLNCYKIFNGQFYFNIDTNIHRLHTPLTNLKKELRNFITYDGLELVSVDIKNSQPVMSGVLLNENFYNSTISGSESDIKFNCKNISKEITTYISNNSSLPSNLSSFIMVCKSSETQNPQGFQPYISECENGVLYEYIQRELMDKCQIEISNRQALKEILFTTLFTDNRYFGQIGAEPKRLFKQLFPSVYEVFAMLKRNDKVFLSKLLQTIESKLMLDYIAKRIAKERPEMPIFTIHDSIVCPVGNEEYISNVMKEEMKKNLGMNPKVSFEYWRPDNLHNKSTSGGIQFLEPTLS